MTESDGKEWIRNMWGVDLFNLEPVLAGNSWTKDANTATVNSVECYRLYNSTYEVWIDTATVTKVIRVKVYDTSARLDYQLDYSDYSDVENVVMLPATILVKAYNDSSTLDWEAEYSFSNINVNESLSSSIFAITHP